MHYYLYIIMGLALLVSFIASRDKTLKALRISAKRFVKIFPAFLTMIILVSIVLYLIPDRVIAEYLGSTNKYSGTLLGAFIGSVTMMPGFIAFPLCGVLLKKGVAYMVLAAFATTLMTVGVLTSPVERAYFGIKVTIIRNTLSFFIALVVAFIVGIFFGEIFR
ncbi:permease [Chloroflexota bacterium]